MDIFIAGFFSHTGPLTCLIYTAGTLNGPQTLCYNEVAVYTQSTTFLNSIICIPIFYPSRKKRFIPEIHFWCMWDEMIRCVCDSPGPFTGLRAVDIRELTQTEPVYGGGVCVAVHGHGRAAGGHLECLPDLLVQLKVCDGAPELRRYKGANRQHKLSLKDLSPIWQLTHIITGPDASNFYTSLNTKNAWITFLIHNKLHISKNVTSPNRPFTSPGL